MKDLVPFYLHAMERSNVRIFRGSNDPTIHPIEEEWRAKSTIQTIYEGKQTSYNRKILRIRLQKQVLRVRGKINNWTKGFG